jgi:hypothetical protein
MVRKAFLVLAMISGVASAQSRQRTAPGTPWHVSTVFTFTHENQPGTAIVSGADIATVPDGYNAVVEQSSARCFGPPQLAIVYGEIAVSSNPLNPGQSGTSGPPPQQDTANHPLLFQTSFSGFSNVFVASQPMTLRVDGSAGRIRFFGSFFNPQSDAATATCLLSISGYLQKH